jgi:transcriptional regulator with XRE-family HTH domain
MAKTANLKSFGDLLYNKRIEKRIGLREICRLVKFDPSNWSKIERGRMAPPSDKATLSLWAKTLGLKENSEEFHTFIDCACIAQGIIPETLSDKKTMELLPAFFRTLRNKKPTKEEAKKLVDLLSKN